MSRTRSPRAQPRPWVASNLMPPAPSPPSCKPLKVRTNGDAKLPSTPSNRLIRLPPEPQDSNEREPNIAVIKTDDSLWLSDFPKLALMSRKILGLGRFSWRVLEVAAFLLAANRLVAQANLPMY